MGCSQSAAVSIYEELSKRLILVLRERCRTSDSARAAKRTNNGPMSIRTGPRKNGKRLCDPLNCRETLCPAIMVFIWPPNSPDLNLDKRVCWTNRSDPWRPHLALLKGSAPNTLVPQHSFGGLAQAMPRRVMAVLATKRTLY